MKNGTWIGWEWEEELHVLMSKNHYVLGFKTLGKRTAVCGVRVADHASSGRGDRACKRCIAWCEKNEPEALENKI